MNKIKLSLIIVFGLLLTSIFSVNIFASNEPYLVMKSSTKFIEDETFEMSVKKTFEADWYEFEAYDYLVNLEDHINKSDLLSNINFMFENEYSSFQYEISASKTVLVDTINYTHLRFKFQQLGEYETDLIVKIYLIASSAFGYLDIETYLTSGQVLAHNNIQSNSFFPYITMEYNYYYDLAQQWFLDGYFYGFGLGVEKGYNDGALDYGFRLQDGTLLTAIEYLERMRTDIEDDAYYQGWLAGLSESNQSSYNKGYDEGYKDGGADKFYSGLEKWIVPAIIVVLIGGGTLAMLARRRRIND